jgi:hypothetical protein
MKFPFVIMRRSKYEKLVKELDKARRNDGRDKKTGKYTGAKKK